MASDSETFAGPSGSAIVVPRVAHVDAKGLCWDWAPERDSPTLRCPNGHIGTLMDHEIAADDTVSPSVQCPHEGCNFHAHVRLGNWSPNKGI